MSLCMWPFDNRGWFSLSFVVYHLLAFFFKTLFLFGRKLSDLLSDSPNMDPNNIKIVNENIQKALRNIRAFVPNLQSAVQREITNQGLIHVHATNFNHTVHFYRAMQMMLDHAPKQSSKLIIEKAEYVKEMHSAQRWINEIEKEKVNEGLMQRASKIQAKLHKETSCDTGRKQAVLREEHNYSNLVILNMMFSIKVKFRSAEFKNALLLACLQLLSRVFVNRIEDMGTPSDYTQIWAVDAPFTHNLALMEWKVIDKVNKLGATIKNLNLPYLDINGAGMIY